MPVNVMYSASATASGGWDGRVVIKDSSLEIRLATPTALGGDGQGNNPEQLFAAGYSVSFLGSMKFVESEGGPKVPADTTVTAIVGIGPRARGGFGLDIQLEIAAPGLPRSEAEALVQKAHAVCPFSKAIRDNVAVRIVIA